nr:hypothetical protein [Lachnospiraceae bacterium]
MKKEYKNFIGSFLFLSGAVIIFVCISYMMRPVDNRNDGMMMGFYGEKNHSLDVIALGSSSVYRFLNNPVLWEEYGITSYNLATGSMQSDVYEMLINESLKTQSPDIILIETRPYIQINQNKKKEDIYFRKASDYMKYSWDRIHYINEYTDDKEKRFQLYFDIVFYHGLWKEFGLGNIYRVDNEYVDRMKGWRSVFESVPMNVPKDYSYVSEQSIEAEKEKELERLIEYCERRGVEILFVATPWEMNEERVAQNRYLERIITEKGYRFLNCNDHIDEIGLNYATDFYDEKHVNVFGAEKVTRFIGQYITENYDMDLTHDKSTISEWDKVLDRYAQEEQESKAEKE